MFFDFQLSLFCMDWATELPLSRAMSWHATSSQLLKLPQILRKHRLQQDLLNLNLDFWLRVGSNYFSDQSQLRLYGCNRRPADRFF